MTREEKILKRKARKYARKGKRIAKDREYLWKGIEYNAGISFGRRRLNGSIFICEMRYGDCERRGYCNGDC